MIPITKHFATIRNFVLVGDVKQLHAVVQSENEKKEWTTDNGQQHSGPVCTFWLQLLMSLMERLQTNSYPSIIFKEQHRMYPGLSQPSSWFYRNRSLDGQSTFDRPRTRMIVEYMEKEYHVQTHTPRFAFNLQHGISLTGVGLSRYNLHHVNLVPIRCSKNHLRSSIDEDD